MLRHDTRSALAGSRPGRSFERITRRDLIRLAEIARLDRGDLFARKPRYQALGGRLLCFALCQGAVLHFVDRADTAGGYAALTLAPPDREVLTVEYKVNFLAPAWGEKLVAVEKVLSAGRRHFVCTAEVEVAWGDGRRTCASLLHTVSLSPRRA